MKKKKILSLSALILLNITNDQYSKYTHGMSHRSPYNCATTQNKD